MRTQSRRSFLRTLGAGVGAGLTGSWALSDTRRDDALNFIIILADDLGWADLNCYGNRIYETPNLDRLAREGMRFTDAYAACPVCSPTRASVMTGMYPARLGLTDWIPGMKSRPTDKLVGPEFLHQLPERLTTIAEALRPLGYTSGSVGKWHLGGEGSLPGDHGFDVNVAGTQAGSPAGGYHLLNKMNLPRAKQGEYLTDHLTAEGLRFIGERRAEPFFLYQPYHSVHTPIQSKPEYEEKYREKVEKIGRRFNAAYAGMVQSLDEGVGRIMDALDEPGLADRTLVIFMSDNGGLSGVTDNAPLRAGKGLIYEGGIREPMIARLPGVTEPGSVCSEPVCSVDFLPTIADLSGADLGGPVDGVSLLPLLRGESMSARPLYWHYPHYSPQGGRPASAVRLGDYKLIHHYEGDRLELFNVREDIGEQHDLADDLPARAARMKRILDDWRSAVGAQAPQPNPAYAAATEKGERDAEFDVLERCAVDSSDLGYALRTAPDAQGYALKKLGEPIEGRASFRLKLQSLQPDRSWDGWRNGFVAFGSSPDEASLICCGLYLGGRRHVSIIEGGLNSSVRTEIPLPDDPYSLFDLEVTVDPDTKTILLTVAGHSMQHELSRPLGPVRYLGYAAVNTITGFSGVEVP